MTTADALARAIADRLLESRKDYRMVPHAGTLADLLRDYERAMVNEELAGPGLRGLRATLLALAEIAAIDGAALDSWDPGGSVDRPSHATQAARWLRERARVSGGDGDSVVIAAARAAAFELAAKVCDEEAETWIEGGDSEGAASARNCANEIRDRLRAGRLR